MNAWKSWAGAAVMLLSLGGCAAQREAQKPPEAPASAPSPAPPAAAAQAPEAPQTDEEKTFYSLGLSLGRQVQVFNMSPRELALVQAGMTASVLDQPPAVDVSAYGPRLQELARERSEARAAVEREKSRAFLDAQAQLPGAERTESGLIFTSVTEGTGARPTATDVVEVHYRGTLADGKEFDSSYKRNEPARFPLNAVIKCWTEALQKMKAGGKARLVCPADLAYGDRGTPGIPGGAALVFDVELLAVNPEQPAPESPPEAPPAPPSSKKSPPKRK